MQAGRQTHDCHPVKVCSGGQAGCKLTASGPAFSLATPARWAVCPLCSAQPKQSRLAHRHEAEPRGSPVCGFLQLLQAGQGFLRGGMLPEVHLVPRLADTGLLGAAAGALAAARLPFAEVARRARVA